ncbi:MAG: ABC transporter ATP-binding protein, partial [Brachybacterium sp.]|nr:ABC transporter ATP-binding protein [Brachybacterium sp.]
MTSPLRVSPTSEPSSGDPTRPDAPILPLELREVHRAVGPARRRVNALRGVSFSARAGAVTVLLGPNGAGKTTLLGLSHGVAPADAGTVRVFGQDPWRAPAALRARIGVMWQESGLPPSVGARRFVDHVARLHRDPVRVDELFERLQISDCAGRTLRSLSGGQRQRVALAAALVGRPDLLFLDEPTAGVDPQTRPVVHEVIREQTERGAAVVLTTHLLDDAERLADDVAILRAGRILRSGTLQELTTHDGGDLLDIEVAATDAAALQAWQASTRFHVMAPAPGAAGLRCRVAGVSTSADLARLSAEWAEHEVLPVSVTRLTHRLDDLLAAAATEAETTPQAAQAEEV